MHFSSKTTTKWAVAFATALAIIGYILYSQNHLAKTDTYEQSEVDAKSISSKTATAMTEPTNAIKNTPRALKSDFYTSKNYSQLIADSKTGGVDAVTAANYAYKLCNYLYGTGHNFASFVATKENRNKANLIQSAAYLDSYRKKTCDLGIDSSGTKLYDQYQSELLEAANRTQDKEYIGVIDIQTKISNGEDMDATQLDSLTSLIAKTDSPSTFLEAANLLATHSGSDWNIGKDYVYGASQEDTLAIVRQGGAALAYCQIYQVCGPNSIVSVNACVPYNCTQGVSYNNIIRNNMTPEQYRIASRIAQDLIQSRRK